MVFFRAVTLSDVNWRLNLLFTALIVGLLLHASAIIVESLKNGLIVRALIHEASTVKEESTIRADVPETKGQQRSAPDDPSFSPEQVSDYSATSFWKAPSSEITMGRRTTPLIPKLQKRTEALEFLKKHPIVFGIPSVSRRTNYLYQTVSWLISKCHKDELPFLKLLILNGNLPPRKHQDIPRIRTDFAKEIESGIITILEYTSMYRRITRPLIQTWDDSPTRIRWRTKQVLDFAYLMSTGSQMADYYVQLEDDIKPIESYLAEIAWWLKEFYHERDDWIALSYYASDLRDDRAEYDIGGFYGFIGQLYKSTELGRVVEYFHEHASTSPVDWLIRDYIFARQKETSNARFKLFHHHPSVFQHVGISSSLANKKQLAHAISFVELDVLESHPPPLVEVDSVRKEEIAHEFLRDNRLILGIPTVKRIGDRLSQTLFNIKKKAGKYLGYVTILILNAEPRPEDHLELLKLVDENRKLVEKGNLVVLEGSASYDRLDGVLKNKWDFPELKSRWHSKMSLDYAYLMKQAAEIYPKAWGYLHLDDDVDMNDDFLLDLGWWISVFSKSKPDWMALSFYDVHIIPDSYEFQLDYFHSCLGKLVKMSDLPPLAEYLHQHFDESPPDWFDHPRVDTLTFRLMRDYIRSKRGKVYSHEPTMFQHISGPSSLPEKREENVIDASQTTESQDLEPSHELEEVESRPRIPDSRFTQRHPIQDRSQQ